MNSNEICGTGVTYHEFFEKEIIAENSIALKAYNEDDTILKIVTNGNMSYMVIAIPITIQKKKIVIELFKDIPNSLYLKDEKLRHEVKILTTTQHMKQTAVKDKLTDLYNIRYINDKLAVDLLNSSLSNEPLSVVFVDLNFFNTIYDKYGHIAGLKVLREFAKELNKHIGIGTNWAASFGDEKFMICLSNTDNEFAKIVVENIRKSIMLKKFDVGDDRIQLSCSFGVHTVNNENGYLNAYNIIKLADNKMYKAGGRSKVISITSQKTRKILAHEHIGGNNG
jgi:diguanylate cyclase (GGDEF)-like protein